VGSQSVKAVVVASDQAQRFYEVVSASVPLPFAYLPPPDSMPTTRHMDPLLWAEVCHALSLSVPPSERMHLIFTSIHRR
jgi:hypothetical protein